VARYTDEQVECLLELYRRMFPDAVDGDPSTYFDFGRSRTWSCLTTDFRALDIAARIRQLDLARRAWRRSGRCEEDGQALARLAHRYQCGYSVGINPWTDSALLFTVTRATKELIVVVGHDWYPVVSSQGYVEARPPLDIFRLLDSHDPRWRKYADGVPTAKQFRRAEIGLLFLNLVPDFRPPGTAAEGRFCFTDPGFSYWTCAEGLRPALELARKSFRLLHVITWGSPVWKALRRFAPGGDAKTLSITEAAKHGRRGFDWLLGQETVRIHPFPHPLPSRRHLNWSKGLFDAYRAMWGELVPERVGM